MLKILIAASVLMALAGCADVHVRMQDPKSGCGADRPFAEGGERATLWIRTSAEFRSLAEGIYRSALVSLQQGISDRGWSAEPTQTRDFSSLPPAVVMDIDETVLDNSAPQAQMLLKGTCPGDFEALWDAWIAERAAPAIPGAAAFIRAARESKDARGRSVRVFLITNRECKARAGAAAACPQQDDTIANLRALGLDTPTLEEDLMMKGERPEWPSEKLSRRQSIARDYRIVLNVGDDLSDFIPDLRGNTLADREHARCRHRNYWGERWIVIPNPIYGSWQRAVGNDLGAALEVPPPPDCDGASLAP
ncbi:MAG: HAD family acid phosphatase [Steroidobacteraceae bacterium]